MAQAPGRGSKKLTVEDMFRSLQRELASLREQNEDTQRQLKYLRRDLSAALLFGRSNNALQTSTYTQFTNFTHLPLEIREMIWELAVPRRLLRFIDASQRSHRVVPSALSVPSVAHVCRESRRVFLSPKRLEALSGKSQYFGGASQLWRLYHFLRHEPVYWSWFTPHKDALLVNPDALMIGLKEDHLLLEVAEHIIIEDAGIWENFLRTDESRQDEEEMFDRLRIEWGGVLPKPKCPPLPDGPAWTLRTMDFAVNSVTKIDRNYPPNFARRLFAGESVRVVDLRDAEAVRGIEQMMVDEVSQFMSPDRCWRWCDGLQKSLKIFNAGGAKLFKEVKEETLAALLRLYYEGSFVDREGTRATLPPPFKRRSSPLDGELDIELDDELPPYQPPCTWLNMEVAWVKEFVERFTIRPVHVFVKDDGWSYEGW